MAGTAAPVHRAPTLTVGTVVWLASEITFFGGLFAGYFTLRNASTEPWPPEGVELEVVIAAVFTLVLVSSSFTVHRATRSLEAGRSAEFQRWLLVTVLLGLVFLANQAREWAAVDFQLDSTPSAVPSS